MTNLLCPDCGHEVGLHGFDTISLIHYCGENNSMVRCKCHTTEINAYRKAQRAAAIAHLRHYGLLACKWRKAQSNKELTSIQRDFLYKCEMDTMNKIYFAIAAYRAVGILPKPKERKP